MTVVCTPRTRRGRRAAVASAGAVIALLVTLTTGCTAEPWANASAETSAPSTTDQAPAPGTPDATVDTVQTPEGTDVVAVGDSVMLASADGLRGALPGIEVNAKVSRQLIDGADLVSEMLASYPDRSVVVLALGINGVGDSADLVEAVKAAGDRSVVLVTAHGPIQSATDVNTAIREVSAQFDNVEIADWDAAISEQPGLLAGDGIHPGGEGGRLYASVVAEAIAEGAK